MAEIQPNTIYYENCLSTMRRMPDNFIDLIITSPPYDNIRQYEGSVHEFDFEPIARELYRVLKPGRVLVWIVGDQVKDHSESCSSFRQALYFRKLGLNLLDTMIYEKNPIHTCSNFAYIQVFEYMFVFVKGAPKITNLLYDKKNKTAGRYSHAYTREGDTLVKRKKEHQTKAFGRRTNIWKYTTGRNNTTNDTFAFEHPAVFPDDLARDHLLSWSNPGDLVYDPMAGSGTVPKVAYLHHRNYIASEVNKKYYDIIQKRLKKYLPQQKLTQEAKS